MIKISDLTAEFEVTGIDKVVEDIEEARNSLNNLNNSISEMLKSMPKE